MDIHTQWTVCPPSCHPSLQHGQIHVWRTMFEHPPAADIDSYRSCLSSDELARAERLRHSAARTQFLVTRGVLRKLLGRYMDAAPSDLRFGRTPEGKPYLQVAPPVPFQFNVSHTVGAALVAVSRLDLVGVDVERMDRKIRVEEIARRFFSDREADKLASIPESLRTSWFLTIWTCKEAYLKMRGTGLRSGLSRCEIQLETGSLTATVSEPHHAAHPSPYSLRRVAPGKDYVGAVAVGSLSPEIFFYDWSPENSG